MAYLLILYKPVLYEYKVQNQFEYHYLVDVDRLDNVTSIKKFDLTCRSEPEL